MAVGWSTYLVINTTLKLSISNLEYQSVDLSQQCTVYTSNNPQDGIRRTLHILSHIQEEFSQYVFSTFWFVSDYRFLFYLLSSQQLELLSIEIYNNYIE